MSGCAILDSGIAARQNGKRLPCEVLQAENAKLLEQIHWLKQGDILHVLTDQEYIDQCERERLMQVSIDALDKDNAKLRELVSGLYKCWLNEGCEGCPMQDDGGWCVRDIRLRELGVEVSE